VPEPDIARQIAELDAQIADIENRIFQNRKRMENQLAKGGEAVELRSAIATLSQSLADLEARKARLQQQPGPMQSCGR
jgi:predicted  nucleic acid-binding Zn-ribbon protein